MADNTPTDGYDFGLGYGADGKGIDDSAIQAKPGLDPLPHSSLPEGTAPEHSTRKSELPVPESRSTWKQPGDRQDQELNMGDASMEIVDDKSDQRVNWDRSVDYGPTRTSACIMRLASVLRGGMNA